MPGCVHLHAFLEGSIVQGEEYPLKNVGYTFCEQFVKRTLTHGFCARMFAMRCLTLWMFFLVEEEEMLGIKS